ncbi:MAG: hypothetical protein GF330_12755 [Candidatus Eisenbacteria bacterium]|nr:hypothetical protein [Candidatus Eisenbacteria bacterium]
MNPHRALILLLALLALPASGAAAWGGFIENRGQIDPRAAFHGSAGASELYFTADGFVIDLPLPAPPGGEGAWDGSGPSVARCAIRFTFVDPLHQKLGADAHRGAAIEPRRPSGAEYNFLIGRDPAGWQTNVRCYDELVYRGLWPGIDLHFFADGHGLSYAASDDAGAPLPDSLFRIEGADRIAATMRGGRQVQEMATAAGVLRHEQARGADGVIRGRIVRATPGSGDGIGGRAAAPSGRAAGWRSAVGSHSAVALHGAADGDRSIFYWSTFLGGSGSERCNDIVVDSLDRPILTGRTSSLDFPTTAGAYQEEFGARHAHAFVAKLDADGSQLLWCTYLGGGIEDTGHRLVLDTGENVIVTGWTESLDFPTTAGAFAEGYGGGPEDGFVAKLDASGSTLLWGSYLGGELADRVYGLAIGEDGGPILTGSTASGDFPTTPGAFGEEFGGGGEDGFVAKLDALGTQLLWSTYLGGGAQEYGYEVVLEADGRPLVSGQTESIDFPTTGGAYSETHNGGYDAFLTLLSADGSALVWSSFLGGAATDTGHGLALDALGNPLVSGRTSSSDFPTTGGAFDETHNGAYDGFVAKFDSLGTQLLWSTYLGGSEAEQNYPLALDAGGNPLIAGMTASTDFPVGSGAQDDTFNGGYYDAFLARLSAAGDSLLWGSYLGGEASDWGLALALTSDGLPIVGGGAESADFPTTPGAFAEEYGGGHRDAFVTMLAVQLVAACCFPDGSCALHTSAACGDLGGEWMPEWNQCDPNPCPMPERACCVEVECTVVTEDSCLTLGGTWYSELESCDPNPCPAACCFWNGDCTLLSEDECLALDGLWISEMLSCDPNPCPPGVGVCCVGATCSVVTEDSCAVLGGEWYSELESCDPNPCQEESPMDAGDARATVRTELLGIHPNPTHSLALVRFALAAESRVTVRIYDVTGREVRTLHDRTTAPGTHTLLWDGRGSDGARVSGGIYLCRFVAAGREDARKLFVFR